MIVRIQKRETPFVQIDKTCLEDTNLSYKAKGLLAYLLSRPNNWQVRIQQLASLSRDGVDAVQSALKELEASGYALLKCVRDSGKMAGTQWVIYEQPVPRHTENQVVGTDRPISRPSGFPDRREIGTLNKKGKDNNKESGSQGSLFNNDGDKGTNNKKGFIPPTLEEAKAFGKSIELPETEVEGFHDYYLSNGWIVGKSRAPMKDWKASMRLWKKTGERFRSNGKPDHREAKRAREFPENIKPKILVPGPNGQLIEKV